MGDKYRKAYTKRSRRSNGNQFYSEPKPRPKSKAKMAWVIAISEDGSEHCLVGKENWSRQPELRIDAHGKPMSVIKEFEAESYRKAREAYEAQL